MEVTMSINDTRGVDLAMILLNSFLRGGDCIILCYSLTGKRACEQLDDLVAALEGNE